MKKINDVRLNAVLNMIKQFCAVVFPLITVPYISRVLGTDSYGKVNFSLSIVNYFIIFAGLGTQNYGTREGARLRQDPKKFQQFASEVFTLNALSVLIAYGALLVVLLCFNGLSEYRGLILVQSLAMVCTWLGADWINSAYEDFTYITLRYIFAQVLAIISMFLLVKNSSDYLIYAIILTFAGYGVNLLNLFYIRRYAHLRFVFSKEIFRHLMPLLILLGNSLAVTVYVNSGITILGIFHTDAEVGIYSVATKVYTIVKQLLNAMLIVFVPRLSAMLGQGQKEEYSKMLNTLLNTLLCLLLPAVVGLMMLSNEIVTLLSGPEFIDAGRSLIVLCISLGFAVFACFFSNCILLPMKKDRLFLTATLVGCLVNIVVNFICIPYWGHIGAAISTVIAEAAVMSVCYFTGRKSVTLSIPLRNLVAAIAGCGLIVVVTMLCKQFFSALALQISAAIILSVLAYLAVQIIIKPPLLTDFLESLKKRKA